MQKQYLKVNQSIAIATERPETLVLTYLNSRFLSLDGFWHCCSPTTQLGVLKQGMLQYCFIISHFVTPSVVFTFFQLQYVWEFEHQTMFFKRLFPQLQNLAAGVGGRGGGECSISPSL